MADSRLCKLSIQLIFVMLSCLELTDKDCCGHAYIFHTCDVGSPAQLHLKKDRLHLTLLTFMEMAEDGEKFGETAKARQDFPQPITADSIKGLGQVYESCM